MTEVIVNGNINNPDETADTDRATDKSASDQALVQIKRLESELKSLKNDMDCMIHGEFDDIKNYVDRAIEHDRLKKRP